MFFKISRCSWRIFHCNVLLFLALRNSECGEAMLRESAAITDFCRQRQSTMTVLHLIYSSKEYLLYPKPHSMDSAKSCRWHVCSQRFCFGNTSSQVSHRVYLNTRLTCFWHFWSHVWQLKYQQWWSRTLWSCIEMRNVNILLHICKKYGYFLVNIIKEWHLLDYESPRWDVKSLKSMWASLEKNLSKNNYANGK